MDLKLEQRRMRTLRRLVLKLFGSLKQDKLVVNDDGALLVCAINAACAALVDARIPMKHLAVAICCCLADVGYVILDPTKLEEQKMKGFAYLVFPNSVLSVLLEGSSLVEGESTEHGIITSVTHGVMPGTLT
ncbi:hypothetical protein BDE02_06G208900 [Populus trichocarpa]|nr:hypothetical protein BDE02_06G208900 [Populus trichocarpa]